MKVTSWRPWHSSRCGKYSLAFCGLLCQSHKQLWGHFAPVPFKYLHPFLSDKEGEEAKRTDEGDGNSNCSSSVSGDISPASTVSNCLNDHQSSYHYQHSHKMITVSSSSSLHAFTKTGSLLGWIWLTPDSLRSPFYHRVWGSHKSRGKKGTSPSETCSG